MTVYEAFDSCVARYPERTALALGAQTVTYRELHRRSRRVARLLRDRGVRPGEFVGVLLESSFDRIASLIAILRCGAAYLPLENRYPAERIGFMLKDAGVRLLLTERAVTNDLAPAGCEPLFLDENALPNAETLPDEQPSNSGKNDAAYLMYTSGTTGVPKGVVIPHRGITRLVCAPDFVDISPDDVFLQLAPLSFDASTLEIWGALLNGARLVLLPTTQPALKEIGEIIKREGVTILWLTGGLFNLIVDERIDDLRPIRQLLVGGEALSVPHIQKARLQLPNTQLINGYGPTENTTFTCCHRIQSDESFPQGVPIGRPIRGTTVKIVDDQLREVRQGEPGELLAGGDGVALGYWHRPELTNQLFISYPPQHPDGAAMFRTGDQVRMRQDGCIEFLGRRDGQIKLRGFRIELGEIETAIRTHEAVKNCAVKMALDPRGQKFLAAYVVLKDGAALTHHRLTEFLAPRLPEYMVPAATVFLDTLPLTPNGKLDRSALPDVQWPRAAAQPTHALSGLERTILEVWQTILGRPSVGIHESFFDAGGNSLLVTQLHERLCRDYGFSMPLTAVFQYPSVRRLAEHLVAPSAPKSSPGVVNGAARGSLQRQAIGRFARR